MRTKNPKSSTAAPIPLPIVTQIVLAEYLELSRLIQQKEQLRLAILQSLELGCRVEAGPFTADIVRGQTHQLTASGLRSVIGEENLRVFMTEIPPTPFRRLVVRENGWGATRRIPRPKWS